ncbi:MAG: GTP-binding protein [Planctomycetota bacterium]|jgi:elongation factor G
MLRNIGIVAHVNAGKTTLSEQILYLTGKQSYLGEVEAGTAAMDWQRQEQERGISISASMSTVHWEEARIHLIDTPGHVDFGPEIERALQVIDGVIVVVDGVRGVESQTESVWRWLEELSVPRLVFVNKLDRDVADFVAAMHPLTERLEAPLLPMVHVEPEKGSCIDLLDTEEHSLVEERARLVEVCADEDAAIMADYVEARRVAPERLLPLLRRATLAGRIVPVYAGSALQGWGVAELLSGVCRFLPGPTDRQRYASGGEELRPETEAETLALLFKVAVEGGEESGYLRVFQGRLRPGEPVETSSGLSFVLPELWSMHAMQHEPLAEAGPGDVLGLEVPAGLRAGDTIRSPGSRLCMSPLEPSPPVLTVALEPQVASDQEALRSAVELLLRQDPSLKLAEDPETGELLVSGMGELHLEVFAENLRSLMPRPPRVTAPRIREAERPLESASGFGDCGRLVGELSIRAQAEVEIRPAAGIGRAQVVVAADAEDPALLESMLRPTAELCAGGLTSCRPLRDARVTLRSVDLGEEAGEASGLLAQDALRLALQRALKEAQVEVLEPWMRFQVRCPDEALSSVLADLRSRSARIAEVMPSYELVTVTGEIALARVIGWATPLRSMSKGRAELLLELSHFAAKEHHKKA